MPFPLAKLLILGLKQATKHVANFAKVKARNNETFKAVLVKSAGCKYRIT